MGYTRAAGAIERFIPRLLNYRAYPRSHWMRIRTTNGLEQDSQGDQEKDKIGRCIPEHGIIPLGVCIYPDVDINEDG